MEGHGGTLAKCYSENCQIFLSTLLKNTLLFDITMWPPFTWYMNLATWWFSPRCFSSWLFSPAVSAPRLFSPKTFQLQDFSAPRLFSPKMFQPQDFSAPNFFSPRPFSPKTFQPQDFSAPRLFSPWTFQPQMFQPLLFFIENMKFHAILNRIGSRISKILQNFNQIRN